jgi:serine/threonine protein kinase
MIGNTLGRYRILELIGKGGMGEVHLALDESLQRKVAIKILPSDCLPNQQDRKKFKREALAISRVNHPNIATVHDFDTFDGVDALIMEYVPGSTLNDIIARGPMPLERCIDLGAQLARGLDAAHRHGVIHRDLKPKNIKVTPDGNLKILDFGMARLLKTTTTCSGSEPPSASESVGGTPSYMSPEQVKGEDVDPASDLFSLGLVLYEMATGRHAFDAAYQAAIVYRIVHDEPAAPSQLRPGLSRDFETLILRLLSKAPVDRGKSAGEIAAELESMGSAPRSPGPKSHKRIFIWSSIWVAGVLLLGFMLAYILRPGAVYSSRSSEGTIRQLTFTGDANIPSWSPDGKYIAFRRSDGVYVMLANGGTARRLISSSRTAIPWDWTKDGNAVLAHEAMGIDGSGQIVRLDLLGTAEQVLVDRAIFPALSPDGRTLAYMNESDSSISLMNIAEGQTTPLVKPERKDYWVYKPKWFPDGKTLTYMRWAGGPGHELWVINRDGTGKHQVESNGIWLAGQYSIAPDGQSALIAGELGGVWYIWRLSLTGQNHERLTEGAEYDCHVGMSPDGRRFVFGRSVDVSRIALLDVETGNITYPIEMSVSNRHPSFAPDGGSLFYQALVNGRWQVWRGFLREKSIVEPILAQREISFESPSANGNDIHHIRSQVGQVSIWGPIKWSQSLWKSAADGGQQRQISAEGEIVSRIAPSPGPSGEVLYSCTSPLTAYETLFLKYSDSDAKVIHRDSDEETIDLFDWGPDEDSAIMVLSADVRTGRSQTIISLNTRSQARTLLLSADQLCRDLGAAKRVRIDQLALGQDRRRLALALRVTDSTGTSQVHIVIRDIRNGDERDIYVHPADESVGHITWSPDGKKLAIEINRQKSDIFIWEPSAPDRMAMR